MEEVVVIIGAGPSGLATAACLTHLSIPYIILEKEDCCGSLWKKQTYDRLKLHLAKEFCSLPFMPHPPEIPTFMNKAIFIHYLDEYASHFNIIPLYHRFVVSATLFDDEGEKKWKILAENKISGEKEVYICNFLVDASGDNNEGFIPQISGLESFKGEVIHSRDYKMGMKYRGKDVLVVGCGNSGMEIAYDLSNYRALPSIVIRSPFHVVSEEMIHLGMRLLKYFPVCVVDMLVVLLARYKFGDLSKFGIHRPSKGPFCLKTLRGRSPVIDVGTIEKIKTGDIKVLPAITSIGEKNVRFENGIEHEFDAIIFATGYRCSTNNWLKENPNAVNGSGILESSFPAHWKGENNLYRAGMTKNGLFGISRDAKAITQDIKRVLSSREKNKVN